MRRQVGLRRNEVGLTLLGRTHTEAALARPADATFVLGRTAGRGRAHPRARVIVLAAGPELPRQALGPTVLVDDELVLRVDRVGAVGEREFEELGLGNGLGRARLDAQVAVNAAEIVDLVDEAVALAGRDRVVDRVVGAAHVDAVRR